MTYAFSAQYGIYSFTQGCADAPPRADMMPRRWRLYETPVFLPLGIRAIVRQASCLSSPGGFACVKHRFGNQVIGRMIASDKNRDYDRDNYFVDSGTG